ncbi:hypothetical protein TNIN_75181 [Trichonephila inaurata madagascariensis]|uniref:Uncharacterized protein n=1 Tax=Trichonephila inaurata madagascariensis TaxID=2747483 RepID=A0A8X6WT20_9ARAC|nr:hypothetical protein TNIN_75181 [Trichonephila inaurata madagascariensis]
MKTFFAVLIVCLIITIVNACPDPPCPDGEYCVRVLGATMCSKLRKRKLLSQVFRFLTGLCSLLVLLSSTSCQEKVYLLSFERNERVVFSISEIYYQRVCNGHACSAEPGRKGVYDMVPPCASGLTCDTSKTIVSSEDD